MKGRTEEEEEEEESNDISRLVYRLVARHKATRFYTAAEYFNG
jgi:hypothetical protein